MAHAGDGQSEGEFRHRQCIAAGGACDGQPQRPGGLEVEIIDADTPFVQQFEPFARPHQRGRHRDLTGDGVVGFRDDRPLMRLVARLAPG